MGKVFFAIIRHAEYEQKANTPSAHQPYPLTTRGEEQAKSCAPKIIEYTQQYHLKLDSVIDCSPVLRAWQTASLLSRQLTSLTATELSLQTSEMLTERCVGSVANLTIDEIENVLRHDPRYDVPPANWKSDSYYKLPFPGAESLAEAGKRVADRLRLLIAELAAYNDNMLKVLVIHGASFRHAAAELGVLTAAEIAKYSMYHAQPLLFEVSENDGNNWVLRAGEWKIRQSRHESEMYD